MTCPALGLDGSCSGVVLPSGHEFQSHFFNILATVIKITGFAAQYILLHGTSLVKLASRLPLSVVGVCDTLTLPINVIAVKLEVSMQTQVLQDFWTSIEGCTALNFNCCQLIHLNQQGHYIFEYLFVSNFVMYLSQVFRL